MARSGGNGVIGVALVMVSGCVPKYGRAFDNSSVDFNRQSLHRFLTPGEQETVADAVVTIMEATGAPCVREVVASLEAEIRRGR